MKTNKRFRRIITVVLCVVVLFTIVPRAKNIYELSVRKNELLQQKEKLTQANQEQQQALAEIESLAGVERIAREQLGMVKEGERAVVKVIPNQ